MKNMNEKRNTGKDIKKGLKDGIKIYGAVLLAEALVANATAHKLQEEYEKGKKEGMQEAYDRIIQELLKKKRGNSDEQ